MLRGLRRSLATAAAITSLLLPRPVAAQLAGLASRAADFAPVDASVLGAARRSSVGLSANGAELVAGGAVGIWSGALHAYVGAASYQWSTGFAYSRTAAAWQVIRGIHATFGEQLSTGYRRYDRYGYSGAVNLRVPLGLTLGNADRASLAVYAAPYAEAGVEHFPSLSCESYLCTRAGMEYRGMNAAGVGGGVRGSAGRVAIGLFFTDVSFKNRFSLPSRSSASIGLSVQLGE